MIVQHCRKTALLSSANLLRGGGAIVSMPTTSAVAIASISPVSIHCETMPIAIKITMTWNYWRLPKILCLIDAFNLYGAADSAPVTVVLIFDLHNDMVSTIGTTLTKLHARHTLGSCAQQPQKYCVAVTRKSNPILGASKRVGWSIPITIVVTVNGHTTIMGSRDQRVL
jgi:hypothetical protein